MGGINRAIDAVIGAVIGVEGLAGRPYPDRLVALRAAGVGLWDVIAAAERWSAILTVVVQPPRTPDALRKNPLGVFVNALNWSKELSQ